MSYSIFYRKQFIKIDENHVITFAEIGDNNVWESDNKKRAREWSNICFRSHNYIQSHTEVMDALESVRQSCIKSAEEQTAKYGDGWAYSDKHFGYHSGMAIYPKSTHNTTYGDFKSFYKTGIAEAMTVEQMFAEGVSLSVYVNAYYYKEALEAAGKVELPSVTITSTEHLLSTLKEYGEYYKGILPVYIRHNGWIDNILTKRKWNKKVNRLARPTTKEAIVVDEYWILADPDGKYFVKGTKNGYRYIWMKFDSRVKAFMTEKQANSFIEKSHHKTFKAIKVEAKKIFWKPAKIQK